MRKVLTLSAISVVLGMSSCLQKDTAVILPAIDTNVQYNEANLGADYKNQLFYNLEHNKIVHTSQYESWDLSFETSPEGYQVQMNGGKQNWISDIQSTHFDELTSNTSINPSWGFDSPTSTTENTYIGDWRDSNKVYIIKIANDANKIYKFRLHSVSSEAYVMGYGNITDRQEKLITIPKDPEYAKAYFSFDDGGKIVTPNPKASTYDLVFTRYRHIYTDLNNTEYYVNGTLLGHKDIVAAIDTVHSWDAIDAAVAEQAQYSANTDIIGFNWKYFDLNNNVYKLYPNKIYLIKRGDGSVWKMKFLSFYNKEGISGTPSWQIQRLK